MVIREIEFRGINTDHLRMYFEELGGEPVTGNWPYIFRGEVWEAEIFKEEELAFTPVFRVNAVWIRFAAGSEDDLEELIRKYRLKTTRIGG